MRTRYKKLKDYGLTTDEENALKDRCKNLDARDIEILHETALSSAPGIEDCICESIIEHTGYRTLYKKKMIPVNEEDFYAYRRKTLAMLYERLKLYGRWKY
ncbi:MAG TPA: hypothetical protein H9717_02235 [Candidatus Eisenbergiella merdipullorum]|uniref:Uncharacterized protein n=1 Tax=Candidatus Eisenbergiella merdipullorum TaxID=2838553 RepID=A0A9D2KXX8_9FIRM|nr:hypothetical protein [Candidatus Eisenbergiella merdipullorum]